MEENVKIDGKALSIEVNRKIVKGIYQDLLKVMEHAQFRERGVKYGCIMVADGVNDSLKSSTFGNVGTGIISHLNVPQSLIEQREDVAGGVIFAVVNLIIFAEKKRLSDGKRELFEKIRKLLEEEI